MVKPNFQRFHEFVVEVETEVPGTWAKICGITGRQVNRALTLEEIPVPKDCEDEAAGTENLVEPGALVVTVGGTAKWARQSHGMMMDWIYFKQRKSVRVAHVAASVGDTEYETGFAYMTTLNDSGEMEGEGKIVTREIELRFDGEPTRTAKAA
ncbi:phage tail tube protein [Neorhizobium sp. JUb45]|uniref:phage tail tube protein n=1 Tax=Neorhizobium sp. JUb45 TaxID=2485113 RepID=UPI0010458F24|nr:phage tail tube protein [Neorhizobium sp. JUb45]TCR01065.1 phage tail tube protein [Neorhizobium sp. JUb45]